MALKLALPTPSTLTVKPAATAVTRVVTSLTVQYYLEEPDKKKLSAKFAELPAVMVIFSGKEYDDNAKSWTDEAVAAKIKELYPF